MELERDVYNKDCLMIPMLEDGRGPADEEDEVSKFSPKASKHCKQNLSLAGQIPIRPTVAGNLFTILSNFSCIFLNPNNFF